MHSACKGNLHSGVESSAEQEHACKEPEQASIRVNVIDRIAARVGIGVPADASPTDSFKYTDAKYGKPPPVVVQAAQPQLPNAPASPKTPADRLKARLPSSPASPSSPLRVPSDTLAPPSSAASDGNITSDGEAPRSPSKVNKTFQS